MQHSRAPGPFPERRDTVICTGLPPVPSTLALGPAAKHLPSQGIAGLDVRRSAKSLCIDRMRKRVTG